MRLLMIGLLTGALTALVACGGQTRGKKDVGNKGPQKKVEKITIDTEKLSFAVPTPSKKGHLLMNIYVPGITSPFTFDNKDIEYSEGVVAMTGSTMEKTTKDKKHKVEAPSWYKSVKVKKSSGESETVDSLIVVVTYYKAVETKGDDDKKKTELTPNLVKGFCMVKTNDKWPIKATSTEYKGDNAKKQKATDIRKKLFDMKECKDGSEEAKSEDELKDEQIKVINEQKDTANSMFEMNVTQTSSEKSLASLRQKLSELESKASDEQKTTIANLKSEIDQIEAELKTKLDEIKNISASKSESLDELRQNKSTAMELTTQFDSLIKDKITSTSGVAKKVEDLAKEIEETE